VFPAPAPARVSRTAEPASPAKPLEASSRRGSEDFSAATLIPDNREAGSRAARQEQAVQPDRDIAPAPPASRLSQRGSAGGSVGARVQDARALAFSYLDLWSASNDRTLQATPSFYGPAVTFHGRPLTFRALMAEKRRFVQRWPDRNYRYRPGTMGVTCARDATSCTVRSTFDFDAANAKLGRRSRGTGTHELVVIFAGDRPVIASETSRVLTRTGSR